MPRNRKTPKHLEPFIDDVKTNPKHYGRKIHQLISLIDKRLQDPAYTYASELAQDVIDTIETFKTYQDAASTKAGEYIKLLDWQLFLIGLMYGLRKKVDHSPAFWKVFLELAKKNGKTTFVAALALYNLFNEKGAEVMIVNASYTLAGKTFDNLREFINQNPVMLEELEGEERNLYINNHALQMVYHPTASKIITFSDGVKSKTQGYNPSFILFDEAALYKSNEIITKLESGRNRDNAPSVMITTAETNKNNAAYAEYERSANILNGRFEFTDYLPMIFELDEEDYNHWNNKELWIKANPSLGSIRSKAQIESAYINAKQDPTQEAAFKAYFLNMWSANPKQGIDSKDWDVAIANASKPEYQTYLKDLSKYEVFGALDLSKSDDFTAYTLYFWIPEIKKYYAKHHFYIPLLSIDKKMRRDSPQIRNWIDRGFITATAGEDGGKVINYAYICQDIINDKQKYPKLNVIGCDPVFMKYVTTLLLTDYKDKETPAIVTFAQDYTKKGKAGNDFIRAALTGAIIDPNPVMAWMVSCAEYDLDRNGNVYWHKMDYFNSSKRIDGVTTSLMALALAQDNTTSGLFAKQYDYSFFLS